MEKTPTSLRILDKLQAPNPADSLKDENTYVNKGKLKVSKDKSNNPADSGGF